MLRSIIQPKTQSGRFFYMSLIAYLVMGISGCTNVPRTDKPATSIARAMETRSFPGDLKSVLKAAINSLQDMDYTIDLCGGTHVSNTGAIKKFAIASIESKGSGIYRIVGHANESIENVLVNKFLNQKLTISTAESCTGGLVGHRLTNVPGSSEIYHGGLITYSNQSKINDLDISAKSIEDFGAVSQEVALEMAKNIRAKLKTNVGISITGIAGPGGGTDLKPVGLVYVGYCDENILKVKKFNFTSNRESNKIRTSQAVFNFILSMI